MKETDVSPNSELLNNLIVMLESEGKSESNTDYKELYDKLYRSLYVLRDFSVDFEVQHSKGVKGKLLKMFRKVWRIGASPYIRYHNQFHAILINTLFIQNALLKELEAKIEKKVAEK